MRADPPSDARPGERAGRSWIVLLGGLAALVLMASIHVGQGAAGVDLDGFVRALFGGAPEQVANVVLGSRLPRLLAGLVAGAGLALAGTLLQTITRNPLAAPDTLAVNAGAYFATVLALVAGIGLGTFSSGAVAFVGGLIAAAVVYLIAAGVGATPTRLLLAGVAVTLFLSAATSTLLLLFEQQTGGMFLWGQGSLIQHSVDRPVAMAPIVLGIAVLVVVLARTFDVLLAGDETARAVGVPVSWVRVGALLLAVLASATAVTICGPIGFVGLVAPHLVRLAGLRLHRWLVPSAAVYGATLLLAADVLARWLSGSGGGGGSELPAGVVTALAGAPFFLWLARRQRVGAGTASAASGGAHPGRVPYPMVLGIAVALVLLAVLLGLKFGETAVGWPDVFGALAGVDSGMAGMVLDLRAPRVLVALLSGAALAASGLVLQGVVRNPLAEPALLGVTGGASVGALVVLFLLPSAAVLLPVGALLGASLAFGISYTVAWRSGIAPERLVLVGVGVSALTAAVVNYLVSVRQMEVSSALTWLSGSIYARGWDEVGLLLWIPLLLLPLAWIGSHHLDVLTLGDDPARGIGLRVEAIRVVLLGLAVALASAAVSVVGTIGFVGLVAPHAARSMVAGKHRRLLLVSMLLGALLVVTADILGRTVLAPQQVPAGLVVAMIGTPYFAYRLFRTRHQRV